MDQNTVVGVGVVVTAAVDGSGYVANTWIRYAGSPESEKATYDRLALTELMDVVYILLSDNRPGTVRLEGGEQPTLWMS